MNTSRPLTDFAAVVTGTTAGHSLILIAAHSEQAIVRGPKPCLWDGNGKQYLDFTQGWTVKALGHCAGDMP
jgi:acetylornithine/N-succinyldiaminopimelate aminotransferase